VVSTVEKPVAVGVQLLVRMSTVVGDRAVGWTDGDVMMRERAKSGRGGNEALWKAATQQGGTNTLSLKASKDACLAAYQGL
jgi:hypothetical protein